MRTMFGDIISAYGGTGVQWNMSTVESMVERANGIRKMMGEFDESQYITTLCTDMRMRLKDYTVKEPW